MKEGERKRLAVLAGTETVVDVARFGEKKREFFAERRRGASLREIGGLLGRAASTISRELGRG